MTHTEGIEIIQYDKTTSVPPLSLILEVKKYEVLYNKQLAEYADTPMKEQIWELIHAELFPNYDELSEDIKNVIKRTVRKRWKSLRDALVKDHRLRGEDPVYRKKKMSQMVKEMQYLTPYIKYPRKHTEGSDGNHSPDFCKLMNDTTIDLTFHEDLDDSNVQVDDDDIVSNEALYPAVHLTTSEMGTGEVEWKNGFCVSATEGYNQPTLNYTIREVEESEAIENKSETRDNPSLKRKRTSSEHDLHSKLIDLVDRCNTESHDEDRMFLLSLLSDFKRVPVQKKLKVKSAFVTALYDALE